MAQYTWLGHACFYIKYNNTSLLIDPWLDNPCKPQTRKDEWLKPDYILITHAHADHFGDTLSILRSSPKTVCICIAEISSYLVSKGISYNQIHGMNKGGTCKLNDDISVTAVHADHSSSFDDSPMSGGEAMGYIIRTSEGTSIYHTGDTAIFGDMSLISAIYKPSVCLMCIGDNYTMGTTEAAYALNHLLPSVKLVIPMHYKTFGLLTGTPEAVEQLLERDDVKIVPIEPGNVFEAH